MWTPATRALHSRKSLRYGTDLTDAEPQVRASEWALVEPIMPPPAPTGRPRKWPMRQIVQAIFYMLRSGCPWSLLPLGFPPSGTVRHWFARFRREGLFAARSCGSLA